MPRVRFGKMTCALICRATNGALVIKWPSTENGIRAREEAVMKIDMHQPILDKNDTLATELRARFAQNHVYVLDLLASPGSG